LKKGNKEKKKKKKNKKGKGGALLQVLQQRAGLRKIQKQVGNGPLAGENLSSRKKKEALCKFLKL